MSGLALATFFALAGAVCGVVYFRLLAATVRTLCGSAIPFATRRRGDAEEMNHRNSEIISASPRLRARNAMAVQAIRFVIVATGFVLAARFGASALLATFGGFLFARMVEMRRAVFS